MCKKVCWQMYIKLGFGKIFGWLKNSPIRSVALVSIVIFSLSEACDKIWRSTGNQPGRPNNSIQLPVISELFASAITTNSALIIWKTPKPSDSTVNFGETTSANTPVTIHVMSVQHSVALSNLKAGTKYYFIASSRDSLGNVNVSAQMSFTTENLSSDVTGPVISNLSATPTPTSGATLLSVSATVSDAATGGSNVVAVECFLDAQGATGTGTALSAQDGVFNSVTENVNGTISIAGLPVGPHTIYAHGSDSRNNWGAFQSFPISVTAATSGDTVGPLTASFNITPNPSAGAASGAISATISDVGTGNSNISAAEYFVDSQGANGTGISLAAKDGAFNSPTEAVSGTINTAGLSLGTHRIYLNGRDSQNNWGGAQFVDLVITSAVGKPDASSLTVVSYGMVSPSSHSTEAVWIEDSLGNFVRSLFVGTYADANTNFLPTWETVSGGQTNGTTGASKSAGSFTATWQPMFQSGGSVMVIQGNYRYRLEYRQEGSAPVVFTGTLSVGNAPSSSSGTNGTPVSSLSASYTP